MRPLAALLAAGLAALALTACSGKDGAEEGALQGAVLVLDLQPNPVHAPIYSAAARGQFEDAGVEVEVREPSSTVDGAKLLVAGRADLAVLDVNDFGIARERGLDLVAVAALVQRPLAAVITADPQAIGRPADLEGASVGVSGVPSDDAVLDTVLDSGGVAPESVDRITIGSAAVPALAAGRVDAATGFWNSEGVELRREGVPTREFRVDELGAPRYPELVLVAPGDREPADPGVVCPLLEGIGRAFIDLERDPQGVLDSMLDELGGADPESQNAQFAELIAGDAFSPRDDGPADPAFDPAAVRDWAAWAKEGGVLAPGTDEAAIAGSFKPGQVRDCALSG